MPPAFVLKLINRRGWVRLSDDWATLHRTLDKLNSLANHPDIAQQNSAVYPLVAANGTEQTYSPDSDPYEQPSPPGSMGFYAAIDSIQPINSQDPRHASAQYSVIVRWTPSHHVVPISPQPRPYHPLQWLTHITVAKSSNTENYFLYLTNHNVI